MNNTLEHIIEQAVSLFNGFTAYLSHKDREAVIVSLSTYVKHDPEKFDTFKKAFRAKVMFDKMTKTEKNKVTCFLYYTRKQLQVRARDYTPPESTTTETTVVQTTAVLLPELSEHPTGREQERLAAQVLTALSEKLGCSIQDCARLIMRVAKITRAETKKIKAA